MYERGPLYKVPYHFPGITILVPTQSEEIVAIDKGSLVPDNIPPKTVNFTLIRYIANITFLRRVDYEKGIMNPVEKFDPPIEFRVAYNFLDVMKSDCNIERLKLAYWDGSQWVIFSDPDHEFQILPPETGQVAEFKIWSWLGDPMTAWGT